MPLTLQHTPMFNQDSSLFFKSKKVESSPRNSSRQLRVHWYVYFLRWIIPQCNSTSLVEISFHSQTQGDATWIFSQYAQALWCIVIIDPDWYRWYYIITLADLLWRTEMNQILLGWGFHIVQQDRPVRCTVDGMRCAERNLRHIQR